MERNVTKGAKNDATIQIIAAVIIPILFSGAMEYLQYKLTLYRTGEFDDFVYNTIGVLLAVLFSFAVTRPLMKWRKNKRNKG